MTKETLPGRGTNDLVVGDQVVKVPRLWKVDQNEDNGDEAVTVSKATTVLQILLKIVKSDVTPCCNDLGMS
jgi:hypothetical protein